MEVTKILEEIKVKEAESSIDVSSLNPGVQSTAEGLKRTAVEELKGLVEQYKFAITQKSVIVAVKGEGAKIYADISKKAGWLAFDFQYLTNKIAESLSKRTDSKIFGNDVWWLFLDELNQLKVEYKISNIPQPMINHTTDSVYEQPIKKAVDNLLKKNYTYSLHSAVLKRLIGDRAFEERFDKEHLPVVLYNCSGVDQEFLPKPISIISVEEDIEPKEVLDHIKGVAQIVAPKKKRGRKPRKDKGESK